MESPLIVCVSLLAEFMGTKCNVYIHWTEPNRTNLYWMNVSTISNDKNIQHNSTDSLDPPCRMNHHHGDSGKMSCLDVILQSVKKQKDRQTENVTPSAPSQVAKMTTQCTTKDGEAAKMTIPCLQWLIMHLNVTGFMKKYKCININIDNYFT